MALHGIDVSTYQGNINWSAVKASGIDFAIVKVIDLIISQQCNQIQLCQRSNFIHALACVKRTRSRLVATVCM